jgi:hypothetical protein
MVFECAYDIGEDETPRSLRNQVRLNRLPLGTQVYLGRYQGLITLDHSRWTFSKTVDGEKFYAYNSFFIIGQIFIQILVNTRGDPAPPLPNGGEQSFLPLVTTDTGKINWPPNLSIGDSNYQRMRTEASPKIRVDSLAGSTIAARLRSAGVWIPSGYL